MAELRRFKQVDVFTPTPLMGNPLAVILDADGLSGGQMLAVARWTNLSETTFVLPPSTAGADYHVRIFSPAGELPFAGHPTLGTAHAMLESGFKPKSADRLIQECGVGLVPLDLSHSGWLAFQAPPARIHTVNESYFPLLNAAVGGATTVTWSPPVVVDMGIRWLVARADGALSCLLMKPDTGALERLLTRCEADGLAVYGLHQPGGPADYEVRAFVVERGALVEDPVTGSANACLARLLHAQGFPDNPAFAESWRVRQGTALGRDGQVRVRFIDGDPWIAGQSITVIDGTFRL
ncbi:PhzF family phenazine biosynthesis protein [Acerihabitans arboris]|uniref:PhzF family phenazine biosynthesis isomerase n=1 Tax=Acerihabitans arboris TaxID=2691583 RepID=A0A845S9W7_9GAMM|nr:PhzF family phenazine biosynthesis protein [Acerihabitans arboris]NDL61540.1 PhzF family phenazine biosynthesis isomerase [Acerihabitans arboris]